MLDFGQVITQGTPEQIRHDPQVQAAHLADEVVVLRRGVVRWRGPSEQAGSDLLAEHLGGAEGKDRQPAPARLPRPT